MGEFDKFQQSISWVLKILFKVMTEEVKIATRQAFSLPDWGSLLAVFILFLLYIALLGPMKAHHGIIFT